MRKKQRCVSSKHGNMWLNRLGIALLAVGVLAASARREADAKSDGGRESDLKPTETEFKKIRREQERRAREAAKAAKGVMQDVRARLDSHGDSSEMVDRIDEDLGRIDDAQTSHDDEVEELDREIDENEP